MSMPMPTPMPRRLLPLIGLLIAALLVYSFRSIDVRESWRAFPLEKIGLGEETSAAKDSSPHAADGAEDAAVDAGHNSSSSGSSSNGEDAAWSVGYKESPFRPGVAKPPGSTYSKMLIVPRMSEEDVSWIHEAFGDDLQTSIYVADDPSAAHHPPKNKGHEVMIYLTYIIENYDSLADVNIFMHSHRWSWHNDDLLDNDAVPMIQRLSAERVQREGYMNMRCHWSPGCPDWMHPGTVEEDINKQEETMLAKSWSELFPLDPIPNVLAQPCCAQFAISAQRVRSLPLARYVFYRDWLLRTQLSDYISGRVWEYIWQFVFTGQNVVCPAEHVCYCDGFGVCFGGAEQYEKYFEMQWRKRGLQEELREWQDMDAAAREAIENGDEAKDVSVPEPGRDQELKADIEVLEVAMMEKKEDAKERGNYAGNRAAEAGRLDWKDGDGF